MKRITLEEIEKNGKFETYEALYRHILSEISSGRLSPVKASGINGKKPGALSAVLGHGGGKRITGV